MCRTQLLQALTAGVACLLITSTSMAQSENHTRSPHLLPLGQEMLIPHGVLFLALSPDQLNQIETILEDTKSSWVTILNQVKELRQSLETMIQNGTADEDAVRSASADLAIAEEELSVVRASVASKIRAILTDEQISALDLLSRYRAVTPSIDAVQDPGEEIEIHEASMLY